MPVAVVPYRVPGGSRRAAADASADRSATLLLYYDSTGDADDADPTDITEVAGIIACVVTCSMTGLALLIPL